MTAVIANGSGGGFRHVLKSVGGSSSSNNGHVKPSHLGNGVNNGLNGHLTSSNHGCTLGPEEKPYFTWTVGLINSKQRFLTAETFGSKVNVTGTSLRKKQLWILTPGREPNVVALRSHLGRFLSLDQYGNVTCEAESPGEGEYFVIVEAGDESGRWGFRNEKYQYFLTGDGEKLAGKSKANPDSDYWTVHLTTHPICTLRSAGRKRYARVRGDEMQCDQDVPWGRDSLLTLEFTPHHHGQQQRSSYSIKTYSGLYLSRSGKLVPEGPTVDPTTAYTLVFHAGQAAFKDATGKFLSPFGNEATLKCKNGAVTKSELFILEHAQPQCSLLAHNGRAVSMRQGVDLSANQDGISEHEVFQLECDRAHHCWRLRTGHNKYWTVQGTTNGLQANGDYGMEGSTFALAYPANGSVALRSLKNGKFVVVRPTGHLFAQADSVNTGEHFQLLMSNRPVLGLRCAYGFVGLKSTGGGGANKLECNKSAFESVKLENGPDGAVFLQASNGLYLDAGDDHCLNADSKDPKPFYIQFRDSGRITLKTPNGYYAVAEQTGLLKASATEQNATEWDY
ncbi:Protein singed [Hypsibius exemplaris]|uniref:Protein singed n=1 Tax=Hypsibius exemplaris TaxID=2072580 RepID=A0A9X6NE88_HYPEX|nr:Protein singed [Hypsibius exemplaris]